MAKKSRRGRGGGSNTTGTGRSTGTARNSTAAPIVATIDSRGCITEKDGLHLCRLVSTLAKLALPCLEEERKIAQGARYKPIERIQSSTGTGSQDVKSMTLMSNFSFHHIEKISQEIDDGIHDSALCSIIGRCLPSNEKATIRMWKMHIEDEFFVIDHLPFKGAIFVQALDPQGPDDPLYAPRCFIVRGISRDWQEVLQGPAKFFENKFPSIKIKHPNLRIAFLRATLLPYMDGITHTTFIQQPRFDRLDTPKKVHEAVDAAIAISQCAALIETKEAAREANVYYTLDPNTDAAIARVTSNTANDAHHHVTMLNQGSGGNQRKQQLKANETLLETAQWCWSPTETPDDPLFKPTLQAVLSGDKPLLLKGCMKQIRMSMTLADNKPCPFHRPFGQLILSFSECCKDKYSDRVAKSKTTGSFVHSAAVFEPYTKIEFDTYHDIPTKDRPDLTEFGNLGFCDMAVVEITIPVDLIPTIKERMDRERAVHATGLYEWSFLSHLPIIRPTVGVLFYGEIRLNPLTGIFAGEAKTAHCLGGLIELMKDVCTGVMVESAMLISEPTYKVKPDREALERNRLLLQNGWEDMIDVIVAINKDVHASIGRRCAYCGGKGKGKLDRCPCKAAYYCTSNCQRSHWKDHKEACISRREINEESNVAC